MARVIFLLAVALSIEPFSDDELENFCGAPSLSYAFFACRELCMQEKIDASCQQALSGKFSISFGDFVWLFRCHDWRNGPLYCLRNMRRNLPHCLAKVQTNDTRRARIKARHCCSTSFRHHGPHLQKSQSQPNFGLKNIFYIDFDLCGGARIRDAWVTLSPGEK